MGEIDCFQTPGAVSDAELSVFRVNEVVQILRHIFVEPKIIYTERRCVEC